MKKLAITIAAVFATLNIFAQGTVNFQNNLNSYVYDDTSGTPALAKAGTDFSVALYWAPVNAAGTQPPDSAFVQQGGSTHVGVRLPSGAYIQPGIYVGGIVNILGITPAGGMGWFEVKAWETAFGNTFETRTGGRFGVSGVVKIGTGDPTITPPGNPAAIYGVGRIDLMVPEPAILGLGLLGGAALLLLRRRK
jgi:hypothetical protein